MRFEAIGSLVATELDRTVRIRHAPVLAGGQSLVLEAEPLSRFELPNPLQKAAVPRLIAEQEVFIESGRFQLRGERGMLEQGFEL